MKDERVIWNQEMRIPIELPLREESIKIQLWDWDALVDEFVCSTELKVANILKYERESLDDDSVQPRMKWINFYGPPDRTSGKNTDIMRRDSSRASNWCGRILVEYFCLPQKYPIYKIVLMKDQNYQDRVVAPFLIKQNYKICVEFGSGICLPNTKDYKIRLAIGPQKWDFTPKEKKRNYCRWDKRQFLDCQFAYKELKAFPTLYVYLMDGDKPICYYRESVINYSQFRPQNEKEQPPENGPYHWL